MSEESTRFIVGLDLSLTAAGLAEYNLDHEHFAVETYGTKGKRTDKYAQRGGRLQTMADHIIAWATAGSSDPVMVVVEGPALGSQNGSFFDRAGLWWLVVSGLQARGIRVLVVPPKTRAKYATGNGNSGKDVVLAHVIEQYADFMDNCSIRNDNEADALVLAAMGARYIGEPQEESLPEGNLAAMAGVEAL
jgi:Holliday junction resolvasome RuvABC endonuclease subunit